MHDFVVQWHGAAIKQAGIYIGIGVGIGVVLAGVVVAIALFRLATAVRDHGQRLS